MILDERHARIARNEASFRDINEDLEKGLRQVRQPPDLLEFVCECGDASCDASIHLTFEEYEAVRADSRHFAIAPGHAFADAETVVFSGDRHQIVEKKGPAVEVTDRTDRRAPGPGGLRAD